MGRFGTFAIVAALTATGASAAVAPASAPSANAAAIAAVGASAPSFGARDVVSGKAIASDAFAGKVLVVNFWATWCPPCRAETADMVRAYQALHGPDVAFLGIDTTEVAPVVTTFLSAKGVPYPVALAGSDVYDAFGISYIPTTIVLDRSGVVRARWTGTLTPKRLAGFVAAAKAGTNYVLQTPDESIAERLLDPAGYDFAGAGAAAAIARARDNGAAAESFADAHSGADPTVDFARVLGLEGTLLEAAGTRALALAATPADRVAADRLLALADNKLGRNADAVAALGDARATAPADASLLLALAKSYYRMHDYAAGIAVAKQYTAAMPNDGDGWYWLGVAYQRSRDFAAAAPPYERALTLKEAAYAAATAPADREDAAADVADTALDTADIYVALGDVASTARSFALSNAYARHFGTDGRYAELARNIVERTQEGAIAVRMAHAGGKTALSLAPWTGPDLPGSVASTLKYRLVVAGAPNTKVDLAVAGLGRGWVASFCADGLCSPLRVGVVLPGSGVKTYEFQLIPPGGPARPGTVAVRANDGATAAIPQ